MYSYRAAVHFVDDVKECMREPTQHIGVFQHRTQVRRLRLALFNLHDMAVAVTARHLDQAQPVAVGIQAHRFTINCHNGAKVESIGQVVLV